MATPEDRTNSPELAIAAPHTLGPRQAKTPQPPPADYQAKTPQPSPADYQRRPPISAKTRNQPHSTSSAGLAPRPTRARAPARSG